MRTLSHFNGCIRRFTFMRESGVINRGILALSPEEFCFIYYYVVSFLCWIRTVNWLIECTDSLLLFSSTSALYYTFRLPHYIHQPPCPSSCHFNLNSWPISFTLIIFWVLFLLDLSVLLTSVQGEAGSEVCAFALLHSPASFMQETP